MAERKPFLLRIDSKLLASLQHWADDELRSLNGQLEFLLRHALMEAGRLLRDDPKGEPKGEEGRRGSRAKNQKNQE